MKSPSSTVGNGDSVHTELGGKGGAEAKDLYMICDKGQN